MNAARQDLTAKLVWLATLAVAVAGYAVVLHPFESAVQAARAAIRADYARLRSDERATAERERIRDLATRIAQDLQRIDLRGRGNSSAGALLVDLNRVAQADSVTLVEVRPDDAEPQSLPSPRPAASAIALTTQTYTIRERGQYERTERFVRDLSLMPTLLRVVAVSISVGQHQPDRPANSALDGTITVQTLRAPAGALADHQGGRR